MITPDDTTREYPVYAICKEDLLDRAAYFEASSYVINLIQAATPQQMDAIARQMLELMESMDDILQQAVENVFNLESWEDDDPLLEASPTASSDGDPVKFAGDLETPDCPVCGYNMSNDGRGPIRASGPVWLCTHCGFGFDSRLHPTR